jgi:hypothetical protein
MTPADFKGVTLDYLVVLEQLFNLNVYVYDLQETEAGPRRRLILPVQSYLRHRSDVTAYRQETIREVGVDQSSRTTQRVYM